MHPRVKAFLGLLVLGALALGCAQAAPTASAPTQAPVSPPTQGPTVRPTAAPTQGGDRASTYIIAASGDLEGWDPATATYYTALDIMANVYDSLLDYDVSTDSQGRAVADVTKFRGKLAETFSVSADGKAWTFKLRKGAKFASGNDVTSADVKYSLDRPLLMGTGILKTMLNLGGIITTTQVVAVDPTTVRIDLDKPNPLLPHMLALAANSGILDSKLVQANCTADDPFGTKWLRNHVAGSGPYSLEKSEPGNQVTFVANKNYWGPAPKMQKVIYKTVPSAQDRMMLLMSGAVDQAYDIPGQDLTTTLKNAQGIKIMSFAAPSTTVFFVNNNLPPFDNVKVRKALCYAVPYQALIDKVLYGLGTPAVGPMANGVLFRKKCNECTYDLAKAKSLLAEAGLAGGFDMTLTYREGRPEEESSAVFLQAELAKINVRVTLEKIQTAAWNERRANKAINAGIDSYTPYAPDPNYVLEFWYKTGASLNTWQYSNKRVDELAKMSVTETDAVKRQALIEEAQDLIGKDQPVIWLFNPYWNLVVRDNVRGYVFYPDRATRPANLSKD